VIRLIHVKPRIVPTCHCFIATIGNNPVFATGNAWERGVQARAFVGRACKALWVRPIRAGNLAQMH
jgi:hypothetical protein